MSTFDLPARTEPPGNHGQMSSGTPVRVLAAVVERNGRFLVCRRPAHKRHGGLWEFPGGKIHPGETDFGAAERELAEELNVRVTRVGAVRFAILDPGSHFSIEFVDVVIDGTPQCIEHTELTWAAPAELLTLPLAPSDARFAAHLVSIPSNDEADA